MDTQVDQQYMMLPLNNPFITALLLHPMPVSFTYNLQLALFQTDLAAVLQYVFQKLHYQGIVGCTPTNVPLWEPPI